MDKSKPPADWLRWLDQRPLDPESLAELSRSVDDNGPDGESLLDDLDLHRQLSCLGQMETEGSGFAERMAACFETTIDPSSNEHPIETPKKPWIDAAISETASPVNGIEIQVSQENPFSRRHDSRKQTRRRKMAWLAGVPAVVACILVGWYVTSANRDDARPPSMADSRTEQAADGNKDNNPSQPVVATDALVDNGQQVIAEGTEDRLVVIPENPFRPIPRRPIGPTAEAKETLVEDSVPASLVRFAVVRETTPCEWGSPVQPDGQVGPGPLDLVSGEALVTFDHGSTLRMHGPAKIELNVTPLGRTEILVRQGAIDVQPWHAQISSDPIVLSKRGLDRGTIQPSTNKRPALASFENDGGGFEGWINVNGRLLKSANRPFVDDVLATANRRWREQPNQFETEWQNLVAMVNEDRPGAIRIGGQQFPMAAFEDLIQRAGGNNSGNNRNPGAPSNSSNSSFQGEIEINGTRIQFESIEEFESARRKLLGSFSESLEHFRK